MTTKEKIQELKCELKRDLLSAIAENGMNCPNVVAELLQDCVKTNENLRLLHRPENEK